MENQGYEEETITRPFNRQYLVESSGLATGETTRSSPTSAQGVEPIAVRNLRAEPEAHVYEDIVVSGLEDSIPADRLSSLPAIAANITNNNNNNNNNHHCNEQESFNWSKPSQRNSTNVRHFLSSNEPISLSSDEVSGNFHRNLTLPLSGSVKTLDTTKNPSRFSVRVTSRERNGCLPIENLSSLCESPVGTSRIGLDMVTVAAGTNVEKPGGRRRRKKDCKHCKSKTNGGAFRELLPGDSIADSTMHEDVTTFPLDVSSGRVQTSETNEFIGREKKTRLEPIFTLPDGKLPSFNSQRVGQAIQPTEPRGNSVFSISNNSNVSGPASAPKPLNYDKNDTDLRLVPVEHSDDRALITPMKNRANGMKVNSIYSQDHWHYKDVPIFVTDIKETSPFQDSEHFTEMFYWEWESVEGHIPKSELVDESYSEFFFRATPECPDLYENCTYFGKEVDCGELFTKRISTRGICCFIEVTQITIATFDRFIEFDAKFFPLSLDLWSTDEYPLHRHAVPTYFLQSAMDLNINLQFTYSTPDVFSLSKNERRCLIPEEYPSLSACIYSITMKNMIEKCGCVPWTMMSDPRNIECVREQYNCLAMNMNISSVYQPDCYLPCNHTFYGVHSISVTSNNRVHIGLPYWPMVIFRRDSTFTWLDFFVCIGGIASLFLSYSFLTIIELIYYFIIRTYCGALFFTSSKTRKNLKSKKAPWRRGINLKEH